ncbi:hypothetical protein IE81DRAFT_330392 [Ceraceosorus guamensis]|uniref:Cysteine proteinase inhibitor n=1 Tax=Ceraceosorus guamensis TaxID=1522189 RepID=A0A316W397_9BASI|nr:hypothetical protein IE81DRAFT_330392 [Ceraceosorus guamensis]PWN42105.1 hypothetical protein IE81DRAFT_330392 [Ceraceosorus guamensis]
MIAGGIFAQLAVVLWTTSFCLAHPVGTLPAWSKSQGLVHSRGLEQKDSVRATLNARADNGEPSQPVAKPRGSPAQVTWHAPTLEGITNPDAREVINNKVRKWSAERTRISGVHIKSIEPTGGSSGHFYEALVDVYDLNWNNLGNHAIRFKTSVPLHL